MSSSPLKSTTNSIHLNQSNLPSNETQSNPKITNVFKTTINTSSPYPPDEKKRKRSNTSNFLPKFDKPNLPNINSINLSINNQIISAHSINEICEICKKNNKNLNEVNISTSLNRIAKYYKTSKLTNSNLILSACLFNLSEKISNQINSFEPRNLSSVAWAFATLNVRDVKLFETIAEESISKIRGFNSQNLSNIAWAFATLEIKNNELFMTIADESISKIKDFNSQNLSNIAWAFATLEIKDVKLFEKIAEESISKIKDFKPQELANLAWAFAILNIKDLVIHNDFFKKIANKSMLKINDFNPQNLSNIAWAFAILNLKYESFFQKIIDKIQEKQFSDFSVLGQRQLKLFYLYTIKNNLKITWPQNLITELKNCSFDKPTQSNLQKDVTSIFKSLTNDFKEEYQIEENLMPIDIAFVEKKIAIEVNGPFHYAYNSDCLLGSDVLKQNLLKSLGWKVYVIPYWQWDKLKTVEEKTKYLKDKFDFLKPIEKSSNNSSITQKK